MFKSRMPLYAGLLFLSVVLVAGCQGPSGPEGAQGPQGPQGVPAPGATGRVVVKDASGSMVAYDAPLYVDGNGYQWLLEMETARPPQDKAPEYFLQPGCAGTAFVVALAPRVPIRLEGTSDPRDFYVRPDNLLAQSISAQSVKRGGVCSATSEALPHVLAVGQLHFARPAQEPAWSFVPPLRLERLP